MHDASLFDLDAARLALTPSEGAQMCLRKSYWKTPILNHPKTVAKFAEACFSRWVLGLPSAISTEWKRHLRGWCSASVRSQGDLTLHHAYVENLVVPSGFVAAQEDKDKASCWILPLHVYLKLFALMVCQDNEHWVRCNEEPRSVAEKYRLEHESNLPPYLQSYAAPKRWSRWNLAYMYVNIKSKCFRSGVGRCCEKVGHACCRRIVSWAAHPCRWIYKRTSRAIEAAIRLWGFGFETVDLSSAVRDFLAATRQLKHDHDFVHCCYRCRLPKNPLCVWVGDAAQLFEEISRHEVARRLKHILDDLAQKSQCPGIVTKRGKRFHYWFARNDHRPSHGACLHRWCDICTVAELALSQTCVQVGPVVFEQRRGVPIGGFLSKQFASVYLGFSEAEWVGKVQNGEFHDWIPEHFSMQQTVAATRYVDDLALASSVLCASCLGGLTSCMYEKPICFDATKPTIAGVPWLDVWLTCDGFDLTVHAHGAELECRSRVADGVPCLPSRFRHMPFQGSALLDLRLLVAVLNGRLKRLHSLDLSHANMKSAVECDLQLWVIHGYPLRVIYEVWRRGRLYPTAVKHAREILQGAMRCCGAGAQIRSLQ